VPELCKSGNPFNDPAPSYKAPDMLTLVLNSMNAPVLVELNGESDPLVIAQKELREKKIPIIIRRYLPDFSYEDWKVEELIVD
jgi:hypothetical protein